MKQYIWQSSILVLQMHFALTFLRGCLGISVTEVVAPPVIKVGGTGDLECRWQLRKEEKLYSLKWYHGMDEIYRYTPSKNRNSVQVFENQYLWVDPQHSWEGRVRVTNISLNAEGLFRCEVSGEAPAFYTDYGTINITVVALPDGGPHIEGLRPQYQMRDWVDLVCISPESKPPATIRLYVNGQQAPKKWLDMPRIRPTHRGKESSQRIHFSVSSDLLGTDGMITVRCDAEIPGLHKGTSEVDLIVRGPYLASVRGEPINNGVEGIPFSFWTIWACTHAFCSSLKYLARRL